MLAQEEVAAESMLSMLQSQCILASSFKEKEVAATLPMLAQEKEVAAESMAGQPREDDIVDWDADEPPLPPPADAADDGWVLVPPNNSGDGGEDESTATLQMQRRSGVLGGAASGSAAAVAPQPLARQSLEDDRPDAQPEPRSRRRSRSVALRRARATSSDSGDWEIRSRLHISARDIPNLHAVHNADLRRVLRKDAAQPHFGDYKASGHHYRPERFAPAEHDRRARDRADLYNDLPGFANPIPTAQEFVEGIPHHNSSPDNAGKKFDVVRAFHSTKMHYIPKLNKALIDSGDAASGAKITFQDAFPNLLPPFGGDVAVDEFHWGKLKSELNVHTEADYLKHILTKHDGEVRLVADDQQWEVLPASGGSPYQACYWHYQFCSEGVTRDWLYQRSLEKSWNRDLTFRDVQWLLTKQNNQTSVLKYIPPVSGGTPLGGTWLIRRGNAITLSEIFEFGSLRCSCFDLYRTYTSLPIFIYKRHHTVSHSATAQTRRNAKLLHYKEHGNYGLPSRR